MEIDVKCLVNRDVIREFFVGLSSVKLRLILGLKYPYRAGLDSCVDDYCIDSIRLNQNKIYIIWIFFKNLNFLFNFYSGILFVL